MSCTVDIACGGVWLCLFLYFIILLIFFLESILNVFHLHDTFYEMHWNENHIQWSEWKKNERYWPNLFTGLFFLAAAQMIILVHKSEFKTAFFLFNKKFIQWAHITWRKTHNCELRHLEYFQSMDKTTPTLGYTISIIHLWLSEQFEIGFIRFPFKIEIHLNVQT